MGFTVSNEGGVVRVTVEGPLTVGNRHELKQLVLSELERGGGGQRFFIDFRQTGYVDSSGLGTLVTLANRIRERSGELRLGNLNEDLMVLFELTKLDALFTIVREDGPPPA